MPSQKDILLSANQVIKQYGDGAEEYAVGMIQKFEAENNNTAASAWRSIAENIKVLRNTSPPEVLH